MTPTKPTRPGRSIGFHRAFKLFTLQDTRHTFPQPHAVCRLDLPAAGPADMAPPHAIKMGPTGLHFKRDTRS